MNKLTYKEAYDKIIQAYFKDEIQPYDSNFCFCGTLAPEIYSNVGYKNWNNHDGKFDQSKHFYLLKEYYRMELALFKPLCATSSVVLPNRPIPIGYCAGKLKKDAEEYEDALFEGMCAALEVLKEIHRIRGENVDDLPVLTKRNLEAVK